VALLGQARVEGVSVVAGLVAELGAEEAVKRVLVDGGLGEPEAPAPEVCLNCLKYCRLCVT
jgi:hypothetical protein